MKNAYQELQSLFDHASDLIQVVTWDGAVRYANPIWYKVLGYESVGAGELSFLEILHPQDSDRFRHYCDELKMTGGDRTLKLHLKKKTGQWLTVEGQTRCLLEDLEEPHFWSLWRVVDSEPSQFQGEEGFLQRVIDSLPSCISMKDVQGRVLLANQTMAELYSATPEEILGRKLTEFQSHLSLEQLKAYQQEDLAVLQTGQTLVKEDFIPLQNGQSRWYQTFLKPFISNEGEVQGVLVNSLEISDRKLAEQKLIQREHYLAALVEVQRYLLECDSSGAIRSSHRTENCYPTILKILGEASNASRAYLFESHTGPSGELLISQRAEWCASGVSAEIDNPQLQNVLLEQFPLLSQVFQRGQVMNAVVADLPEPERKAFQAQGILSILNLPLMVDDEFFGIIGFDDCLEARVWDSSAIDFMQAAAAAIALFVEGQRAETVRQQAETKILEALQKEKELSELRSNFVTTVSHDFRTPLTVIQSASELLQYNDWDSHERLEFLSQIRTAVQHMTHLLEDVLLIGQIESGNVQCRPSLLELRGFCIRIIHELQLAYGKDYNFEFTVDGVPVPLLLDQKLIRQILTNLLSNAAKYSPPGRTVELHLNYFPEQIVLQVRDQGIGIPVGDRETLFRAFHRASNIGNIEGTGLGLAIVKRCVELHQGQITLQSEVGVGSTFTVNLPLQQTPS